MVNILGVSIGTRNVGMAVIRLRVLTDYRIRSFPGKWTDAKRRRILEVIETLVVMNRITDITLKIPDVHHCSTGTSDLIRDIEALAGVHTIRMHRCTDGEIKMLLSGNGRCTKSVVADALIKKYPKLKNRWGGSKKAKTYNAKLFEAIACAELALRAGH